MAEPPLTPAAKARILARLFEHHTIPYAIGGGMALIYCSEPA